MSFSADDKSKKLHVRTVHPRHVGPMRGLEKIASLLKLGEASRTVVMAGAGISTPSGLPDFRSPKTGIYSIAEKYNLPYAEAIFDIDYFHRNPKPFFDLSKSLYPGQYSPNECHWLMRLLQDKQRLLRVYTQNIDGMERLAGVKVDNLVEAHGTYFTATCTMCLEKYPSDCFKSAIFKDEIPQCKKCQGVVKPDIVFFGEQLPQRFMLHLVDMPLADLLIVMGTSLEVYPFAGIASTTAPGVPRLLINQHIVGTFISDPKENDVVFEGDVVNGVRQLCDLAGWSEELGALHDAYARERKLHNSTGREE